jgi:hypothetical protein
LPVVLRPILTARICATTAVPATPGGLGEIHGGRRRGVDGDHAPRELDGRRGRRGTATESQPAGERKRGVSTASLPRRGGIYLASTSVTEGGSSGEGRRRLVEGGAGPCNGNLPGCYSLWGRAWSIVCSLGHERPRPLSSSPRRHVRDGRGEQASYWRQV